MDGETSLYKCRNNNTTTTTNDNNPMDNINQ